MYLRLLHHQVVLPQQPASVEEALQKVLRDAQQTETAKIENQKIAKPVQ